MAQWWTCECGKRQCATGFGTPICEECSAAAKFTVAAPKEQGGFDFEVESTSTKGTRSYADGD
jgi:hypothetical protein